MASGLDNDNVLLAGLIGLVIFSVLGALGGDVDRDPSPRNQNTSQSNLVERNASKNSIQGNYLESPWAGKVTISKGNASSEYQPYKEYITLQTRSLKKDETVNITGWSLVNGAGTRLYQLNDTLVKGTSGRAYIPQASKVFLTSGQNFLSPVILGAGYKATVITGDVPNKSPFAVTSFQVNKCSGYIEKMDDYRFYPTVSSSCPDPSNEEGVEYLENSCYKFVNSLQRCHTPEFPERTMINGNWETGYVDGVGGLSNQCKAFIKTHYSYNSCVALHGADEDFYKKEWRIFLNQPWEMYAKERETITLLDSQGLLVDSLEY